MTATEIWNAYYNGVHSIPFYMDAKEGKNLKLLVQKISRFWLDKTGTQLDDEQTMDALKHLLERIDDEFTLQQLTPSMVNSRFNIIAQQIYSERKPKTTSIKIKIEAPTPEQLEEIAQIKRAYKNQKYNGEQ